MADLSDLDAIRSGRYVHEDVWALCDEIDRLRAALDKAPRVTVTIHEPPAPPTDVSAMRYQSALVERMATVCIESADTRTTFTIPTSRITHEAGTPSPTPQG